MYTGNLVDCSIYIVSITKGHTGLPSINPGWTLYVINEEHSEGSRY